MQEAMFYHQKENGLLFCELCPKGCSIREGHKGFCRVRENQKGVLYTLNYGKVSSYAMDPMEKKPLYHFYPGTLILSLGTVGCNLRCGFCQNWQIAHGDPHTLNLKPREAVELALEQRKKGFPCTGIAYTYSEPFMWYEYVYDTSRLAREAGLKNVMVTNGYVREEPLKKLLPFIDAMNIDVKGFTDRYYRESCVGHLEPVKRTVEIAHQECHVELTTLLVPELNDTPDEISELVDWVASLNPEIPLHFSRYFPNYQFDQPPTPLETMQRAYEIAKRKLKNVHLGNV
ncbi:Radical SAM domain protein [Desulforamulus reducens MI-1]|uniref:Radical SAM domain protein n=1 Tax=Desulforamulus reducens (strain ATCC BAA-1160 / DSM 100696 / MI-1) TaxID=349161 RepID=A4J166_DESRM|nr:AmmeMemoRadiSam system radical SAM enzyme [Desulforamulus reducens]ABO48819.1 Radical SAM domain protein [Desulforamulus reducens MI-1]